MQFMKFTVIFVEKSGMDLQPHSREGAGMEGGRCGDVHGSYSDKTNCKVIPYMQKQ